jgi:hypothetical protein
MAKPTTARAQRIGRADCAQGGGPVSSMVHDPTNPENLMDAQRSQGRFSEGQEQLADTAAKERVGRFSDGEEQLADTAAKERVGRFSEGEEQLPETPEKERVGTFGGGVRQVAD